MMGRLVKSEFRKIFSTKMWWALLIPAAVIALLANWAISATKHSAEDVAGTSLQIPSGLLSLGASFTSTAVIAVIYGATALSSEFRHRTITTTYLIAPRGAVLGAKLIAFAVMGLLYGLVTLVFSIFGVLIGGGSDPLPAAGSLLLMSLVGIVMIMLWTLLGVGFGAWIKNQIAAVVVLILYILVGEPLISAVLTNAGAKISPYLPAKTAENTITQFSLDRFFADSPSSIVAHRDDLLRTFGLADLPAWWATGLVFLAYAAVIALIGWVVSRARDIT